MDVVDQISLVSYNCKKGWLIKNCPHPQALQLSFYNIKKQSLVFGQIEVDYKSRAQQNWWGTFGAQLRAYDNDVIQLFLLFADSTQPIKIQTTLGIVVPRPQVNFVANIWLILVTCFRFIMSSNVAARTVLSKNRFEYIKIMTISS